MNSLSFIAIIVLFFNRNTDYFLNTRALKFRFGKYVSIMRPGFRLIIPFVETIQVVDIRVITINIVSQEVMTEDNVPCSIDGVVF
jgi:regulator of protease activity HflC (stomatin/prohibitin superfamily)